MKQKTLENALSAISDDIIMEAAAETTPKRSGKRLPKRILVPAAVLVIMTVCLFTVNAFTPVNLDFYITSKFGGGYELVDEMTSLPTTTTTRYADDTLSIELKGVLGDVATAYIFFDVTVAPDADLPEDYHLDIKLNELALPWDVLSYGFSHGEHAERVKNEDGSVTHKCYICINQTNLNEDTAYSLSGRGFSIVIDRIFGFDEDYHKVTWKDGNWSIGFVLDYKDLTTVYEIGEAFTIEQPEYLSRGDEVHGGGEDITVHIDRITLSPLSMGVYFSVPAESEAKITKDAFSDYIGLRMKDGSIYASSGSIFSNMVPYSVSGASGGAKRGEDGVFHHHEILSFASPIDVNEAAAVLVSNAEISSEAN